ncbi:hypothetical protein QJS10_CPB22g00373 [Acorus calamus]|uniref:Uncharacterized protein n=1 Tax=Acorus calamus TaxID=4465 RepID=A0AAV9BZ27_ACOCL|nr:hypothetical protein QJS10_CPB22g00373 [Acorus calamus]
MDDNMNKAWKKPKVEEDESDMNGGGGCSLEEQEEALVALIEHPLRRSNISASGPPTISPRWQKLRRN